MNEIKRKWSQTLQAMIEWHREQNPADSRSDVELYESIMEHFHQQGIVKKSSDGKWILPDIDGIFPLINCCRA